jgi:TetR/AcrR family transcriptional repressor of bet genes
VGRKPNTAVRRRQIIDALLSEMSTIGYERASTKSIAAKAGLAAGLLHYHFKSKQEILLALIDQLIADAEGRFSSVLDSRMEPAAKLAAYVSTRVGLGPQSDPEQVKAWVSILSEAMGQPAVQERVARWLSDDLKRVATLLIDAGSAEPQEHAATMLAMILGSFSLFALRPRGAPSGHAERQILAWLSMLLRSISERRVVVSP